MRRGAIERLLPGVYQASIAPGTPLAALLDVMEQLHEPDEEILADLDRYFDPYLAPPAFVAFLARWVDAGWLVGDPPGDPTFLPGIGHLRNVVATMPELSRRRGTADGLRAFLETATGIRGFEIDERGGGRPFHVRVVAPEEVTAAGLGPLVERIVEYEHPAHATYDVVFRGQPVSSEGTPELPSPPTEEDGTRSS